MSELHHYTHSHATVGFQTDNTVSVTLRAENQPGVTLDIDPKSDFAGALVAFLQTAQQEVSLHPEVEVKGEESRQVVVRRTGEVLFETTSPLGPMALLECYRAFSMGYLKGKEEGMTDAYSRFSEMLG